LQVDQDRDVVRHIQVLYRLGAVGGLTDGELLSRFIGRGGEDSELAFAALVERHGPMVLAVCRSVLRNAHDAQDAFQATFLVLARRPGAVRRRDSVGSWLYGVALRVATCAKVAAARRQVHEERAAGLRMAHTDAGAPPVDLVSILHEEVGRLPERYRAAVVLCYLEGQTCEAAAGQLGWPVGTVKSRLARGRERLRSRLSRRGLAAPTAGVVASALLAESASAAVSKPLVGSTVRIAMQFTAHGAAGVVSSVATLSGKVLGDMIMRKARSFAAALLILPVVAFGVVGFARQDPGGIESRVSPQEGRGRILEEAVPLPPREDAADWLAIARDGKSLAASGLNGQVMLLDPATGEKRATLANAERVCSRAIAFAPDGRTIACGGDDNRVRFWDTVSGTLIRTSPGLVGPETEKHRQFICTSVAYSPDGQTLAVAGCRLKGGRFGVREEPLSEVRLFNANTSQSVWSHLCRSAIALRVAFTPDGKSLAVTAHSGVKILDAETGNLVRTFRPAKGGMITWLEISPDGAVLAGASVVSTQAMGHIMVTLWDLQSGAILRSLDWNAGAMGGMFAFSPDSKTLATGGHSEVKKELIVLDDKRTAMRKAVDYSVKLWDVATGRLIWTSTIGNRRNVSALVFTPDGDGIICCHDKITTRIDAKTGQLRHDLLKPAPYPTSLERVN